MNKAKINVLRAQINQGELFYNLKNAVVITMITISHIYQHCNLSYLYDATKYLAYTLWYFTVATVYKIKHFMLARRQFASIKSALL